MTRLYWIVGPLRVCFWHDSGSPLGLNAGMRRSLRNPHNDPPRYRDRPRAPVGLVPTIGRAPKREACHTRNMADINAPLTLAEFDSLREVSKTTGQRVIPQNHRAMLIKLGFIEQKLGGLALTPDGQLRVARGH